LGSGCEGLLSGAAGPCPYFRLSLSSTASVEQLEDGVARLRQALLQAQAQAPPAAVAAAAAAAAVAAA
jgi:hypothetical protein